MLSKDGCERRGFLTYSCAVKDGANAPVLTKLPTGPSEDNFAIRIVFSAHLAKLRTLPTSYQLQQNQPKKELLTLGTNVLDQSIMSFSDKCGTVTRKAWPTTKRPSIQGSMARIRGPTSFPSSIRLSHASLLTGLDLAPPTPPQLPCAGQGQQSQWEGRGRLHLQEARRPQGPCH